MRRSPRPELRSRIAKWRHLVLAMAITEPGCGSDPSRVQTTAELDGDEWVINGEKIFVTTGIRAEGAVIWATIDRSAGRAGIKSFLVEKGTPGFDVPHKEKKLGIRADDTAVYVFQDCRIPRENLLGGDESIPKASSGGFRGVMKTFNMTSARWSPGWAWASPKRPSTSPESSSKKRASFLDYGAGTANQPAAVVKLMRLEALFEASMLTTLRACWQA